VEETEGCQDVSLVYKLTQGDQRRLYEVGIHTVKDLAEADLEDLRSKFEDWSYDKIVRFHNQANVLLTREPIILKKPTFPVVANEIYFDIESDPTEGIDYLLGALVRTADGKTAYQYFLAQDRADEAANWRRWLDWLETLEDFVIYHYSYYEREVFRRLADKYGIALALESKFKNNTLDLHQVAIETAVLPLYFYSLKDIAKFIGFQWEAEDAGGAESVVWYNDWLKTRHGGQAGDRKIMDKILKYNEDDVRATLFVKEWLEKQKPRTSKEKLPEE